MDASIVTSLFLILFGAKFAFDAIRLLRSREIRVIEDKLPPNNKISLLTKSDSRRIGFALGIGSYCLAWAQYVSPPQPPFTGRWGWLDSLMYQNLGSNGIVLLSVFVGTVLLYAVAKPPNQ